MSLRKRLSVSSTRSESPLVFSAVPNAESEEWVNVWRQVLARDFIESPVVAVDAETSVEDACDMLLSKDLSCLAINSRPESPPLSTPYHGLFDYADVNAFLTLAATRHKLAPEELRDKPRVREIVAAAIAGRVPVYLVSNLSEKNPLETLPHDATLVSLLSVFAKGTHRVLIRSPPPSNSFLGMISDRQLLAWFMNYAQQTPSLLRFITNPLHSLALPSLYLYMSVVAAKATDSVLDAMRLMSDEGVSSVAVIEEEVGSLLSAVSVTDVGKIVVPAQSNQILSMPLGQFVALIKEPDGSTDGVDKFPVYSVTPSSTLFYTMQKLLATNSHRLFVTDDSPVTSPGASTSGNLSGIVSVVDALSLFARIANIPDVDPTRMQRHRRASSSASSQSPSDSGYGRSRSSSRTSMQRLSASELRSPMVGKESLPWADRVPR
ncbi:hypothetical protein CERSUDRAFT_119018 [Gelatoporia subvermispora B]|uniref:CBS domain-containing protein n=1 Tax=Ceriporiopsis subvermispora (strain B) TaxID=914234 RepID=M2PA16_CERS8|nr:hypothetical protein CERSUDRAFT_119018 [Gelatoporia subvermispora B]